MNKFYLLILLALFTFGCKTASKAYDKGNYFEAIDLAIKKLQKNGNDGETKAMLKNAYHFAVADQEDKIRIISNTTDENRFERMYREYSVLQSLYENINHYPAAAAVVRPLDYSSYVQTYKDKAANIHYDKGMEWMKQEDKKSYREAYYEFGAALKLNPQDDDLKRKREEAYNAALVKVVILPMDRFSNYYYTDNAYQIRRFEDDLIRNLNYNAGNNMVAFYNEPEARRTNLQPDEVVEMRLGNFIVGQPYDEYRTREVSKEVVIKEIVYRKDSVVKEYGRVTARITSTKRTLVSEGDLYVTSRNAQGRILWSDNFRGQYRWETEFATFQGDERALSDNDKAMLHQRDRNPPRPNDMMEEVLNRIRNEALYKIKGYYQRYY
ncbi:MAG: hypothetical protein ABIN57_04755 [Chitinophagaceae bacterium]